MKTFTRPVLTLAAALVLLLAVTPVMADVPIRVSQAEATSSTIQDQLRADLSAAAKQAGVAIQTEQMLTVVREGVTFASAVIDGFEKVGAVNLPGGVDFGFAFLDAPTSGIPTGYYTLRASGNNPQLGENEVRVDLVDRDGRVATSLPGTANVWSLDVPANPPAPRTVIGGGLDTTPDFAIIWIYGWYHCPNGMWICFDIIIFNDFSHF